MNKEQLTHRVFESLTQNFNGKITKVMAEEVVHEIFTLVLQCLAVGGTVRLPEIGTLEVVQVKPRLARNPITGETFTTKQKRKVKYKMSNGVREIMNTL